MLIVISGPSGSGKSTIVREMLARIPALRFSVSATTRPRRPGEREGIDYFFLGAEDFRRKIADGDLVEWEEIFGNCYGTLRTAVEAALAAGEHMLFDIDVKGALAISRKYPEATLTIFILPPDMAVLRERLVRRGTDAPDVVERRLARAAMELGLAPEFRHRVLNDDLARAVAETESIIRRAVEPAAHH